jgi:D-cysteine desulfhydrase family pyridoxal phosphate-dependent enzyme
MQAIELKRVSLLAGTTPVHRLERLERALGQQAPHLWAKRDDLTPLALGGNKLRKLEYLLADALAHRADVIVTAGAAQSNHCAQTAAACNRLGLECVLVLRGPQPAARQGNLVLDALFGARVVYRDMDLETRNEAAQEVVAGLEAAGRRPYFIPVGGSNGLGAVGYANAALELAEQARADGIEVSAVLCASGSGGTQAGLVLAQQHFGLPLRVIGVSVRADSQSLCRRVASIASEGARLLAGQPIDAGQVEVLDAYVGPGYGVVSHDGREAIELLARTEGIMLDPVYTGKAMAGLIDQVRQGHFSADDNVVFVHTGGAAAVFAYSRELLDDEAI